jgi:CheY-like chemotaxis protein
VPCSLPAVPCSPDWTRRRVHRRCIAMTSFSVLVIEDDEDGRAILSDSLRFAGYTVVEARDGVEGLTALVRHRPAIVLLDLHMPRMDGCGFLHRRRLVQVGVARAVCAAALRRSPSLSNQPRVLFGRVRWNGARLRGELQAAARTSIQLEACARDVSYLHGLQRFALGAGGHGRCLFGRCHHPRYSPR